MCWFCRYDGVNEHIDFFLKKVSQVNQDEECVQDFLLLYARCYEVSVTQAFYYMWDNDGLVISMACYSLHKGIPSPKVSGTVCGRYFARSHEFT